jgi:hypothetical protein
MRPLGIVEQDHRLVNRRKRLLPAPKHTAKQPVALVFFE